MGVSQMTADLIVAGGGPAGTAAAIRAAGAGLDVVLLDKAPAFPRPKVCGDALTPRAVAALGRLDVDIPSTWQPACGLAAWGEGDHPYPFIWPAAAGPHLAYAVPRSQMDAHLLVTAQAAGARVELGRTVTGLLLEGGRAVGVTTNNDTWRAPVIVDATGASSRLGVAAGMPRLPDRPMGVAVRGYMRGVDGAGEPWLHSWLALAGQDGTPLPGYGWVFPLGNGLFNVGVGQLSTSVSFRHTDYRALLRQWVSTLPSDWGLAWVDAKPDIGGAMLPMGIDRRVVYRRGVLLTGDAAGLVNPFNGEGVSYALDSGEMAGRAAVIAHRLGIGTPAAETALQGYHHSVKNAFGHYFWAGNLFTRLMGHQDVLTACLRHGLPRAWVMRPVNKLMANLIAPSGGSLDDRVLRGMLRFMPSA